MPPNPLMVFMRVRGGCWETLSAHWVQVTAWDVASPKSLWTRRGFRTLLTTRAPRT